MKRKRQNRHKSFTLAELVIVVIIVGIIAALGVSGYQKVVVKAKSGKAKHAISLIAEAEKEYRMDYGVYWPVAAGAVDAGIGTNATGMNLSAVDNDSDFNYSVTAAGLIRASNPAAIGACPPNSTSTLDLATGTWNIPACYK